MKILKDGTVEGTPEELAAYELAKQRLIDSGKPTVPAPLPLPDPWPHIPFDPPNPNPPRRIPYGTGDAEWTHDGPAPVMRFLNDGVCDSCRNGGVCGCILSNPGVRC